MRNLDGMPLQLDQLRGKVVLLNFWRFNCRYCRIEKKRLKRMLERLDRNDVEVLCVNLWDRPSSVKRYAGKLPDEFRFATRTGRIRPMVENVARGKVVGYFIVNGNNEAVYEIKGFPSTFVIDKEGRVVASHMGLGEWDTQVVTTWLAGLANSGDSPVTAPEDYRLPGWLDRLLSPEIRSMPSQGIRDSVAGRGPVR